MAENSSRIKNEWAVLSIKVDSSILQTYSVIEANHLWAADPAIDVSISRRPLLVLPSLNVFLIELSDFFEQIIWYPCFFEALFSVIMLTSRLV